jgi:hypothetical protein
MFGIEKDFQKLMEQVYGPLNKDKMTDLKFTSPSGETTLKFEDTGRIGTVSPKTQLHIKMDEPVKYEKPMTAVEDIEAQIKVLQSKLEFYKELERTKTPCEEAYKRVYGNYPTTNITDGCWDSPTWMHFVNGYKSAQKDYKVGEFQEPEEEPEELKTLYQMLDDKKHHPDTCVFICDIVKNWMSQYTHNVMTGEYLKGYEECLTVLEENLK